MNLKKIIAATTVVTVIATQGMMGITSAATTSTNSAWTDAVNFMKAQGLSSTANSVADYNPMATVKREAAAKFFVAFAKKEFGTKADSTKNCNFSDINEANSVFVPSIIEACQMGILRGANGKFMPKATLTKLQFLTVLARITKKDSSIEPAGAFTALKSEGITKADSLASTVRPVSRIELAMLFKRGTEKYAISNSDTTGSDDTSGSDIGSVLGSILGGDDTTSTTTGDTTSTTTGNTTTGDTTTTTTTTSGEDKLVVSLNPNTPAASDLADGVNSNVLKFDVTAGDKDVTVKTITLKRNGLGASDAVDSVVIFNGAERVSKSKKFNSTTDIAEVNLNPELTVKAGTTITLTARVNTATNPSSTLTFSVSVEAINATSPVELNSVESQKFGVVNITTTSLTIDTDGSVSNPKLWEKQADLLKFKVTNGGEGKEDVNLSSITIKDNESNIDSDVSNIALYHNGVAVATVSSVDGKYVTFDLANPVVIAQDKTEKFVVKADITDGANDKINLYIDNTLDVDATASRNGNASITNNLAASNSVTIQAGQVTIIDTDPVNTDVLDNKDNVVFGKMTVTANAGKDLYVDSLKYTLANTIAHNLDTDLENVELYDATNNVTYDTDTTSFSAQTKKFVFTDLDIKIPNGSNVTLEIRADIKKDANTSDKIHASVDVANDVVIKENTDDKTVTDVVPSAISFKNIEIVGADMTINSLVQSNTNSVIWTTSVDAFDFEVRSNSDSSDLTVKELTVEGDITDSSNGNWAGVLSNSRVNALYLYQWDTLLSQKSASELNGNGEVTFDDFNVVVAKNTAKTFTVKVDILDDSNNANDTIKLSLVKYYVEDSESDNVYLAGDSANSYTAKTSNRTITIKWVGSLTVVADNTDTEVDKDKNITAGTTSPFVASYEVTAVNEWIKIKDLKIDQTTAGVDLQDAVAEIVLYANDKTTEIARQIVTSDTVTFNNIDYVATEGSSNIYVKVITHKIGKDESGSLISDLVLKLTVTDAEGASSAKTINMPAQTAASNKFSVVPVRISAVSFVNTYGGETVSSSLTNGSNTLGIIAVTTDSSDNTNSTDGSALKTELESMKVTISTDAPYDKSNNTAATDFTNLTVEKINGTNWVQPITEQADGTTALAEDAIPTDMNIFRGVALGSDKEIDNATTVYYVVKADFSSLDSSNNKYIQLKLNDLDNSTTKTVEYSSDNVDDVDWTWNASDNITSLRIGVTSIDGTSISSNY